MSIQKSANNTIASTTSVSWEGKITYKKGLLVKSRYAKISPDKIVIQKKKYGKVIHELSKEIVNSQCIFVQTCMDNEFVANHLVTIH